MFNFAASLLDMACLLGKSLFLMNNGLVFASIGFLNILNIAGKICSQCSPPPLTISNNIHVPERLSCLFVIKLHGVLQFQSLYSVKRSVMTKSSSYVRYAFGRVYYSLELGCGGVEFGSRMLFTTPWPIN